MSEEELLKACIEYEEFHFLLAAEEYAKDLEKYGNDSLISNSSLKMFMTHFFMRRLLKKNKEEINERNQGK